MFATIRIYKLMRTGRRLFHRYFSFQNIAAVISAAVALVWSKRGDLKPLAAECLNLQIDAAERSGHEAIDIAVRAFDVSQNDQATEFAADGAAKRRIFEVLGDSPRIMSQFSERAPEQA